MIHASVGPGNGDPLPHADIVVRPEERVEPALLGRECHREEVVVVGALLRFGEDTELHLGNLGATRQPPQSIFTNRNLRRRPSGSSDDGSSWYPAGCSQPSRSSTESVGCRSRWPTSAPLRALFQ